MSGALLDSSVLLDVLTGNAAWADWSRDRIAEAKAAGGAFTNPIVYAEASVGFGRIEAFEAALTPFGIAMREIPRPALFLAGKVHAAYRRRGGDRAAILPDVLIAAHAAVAGMPLITRDVRRIRTSFPKLRLITPTTH